MRKLALTLVPLFLVACSGDLTAPRRTQLRAPSVASKSANGAQVIQSTFEVPINWLVSSADLPCLKESIQVSGNFLEHDVLVIGGTELHLTVHQSTNSVTATGVTSGDRYAFSGPLTYSATVPADGIVVREFTYHNINHIVGPGKDSDILFRTLHHVTFYPNGDIKVEVLKDDVRCS